MQTILIANMRAAIVAMWALIHPGLPASGDGPEVAADIAQAVVEDGENAPVYSSHAEDAALMAYYAYRESWLRSSAVDAAGCMGVWQFCSPIGRASILTQARAWLRLLHDGKALCPDSPAAPLSGGCAQARGLADRRGQRARELLGRVLGVQ